MSGKSIADSFYNHDPYTNENPEVAVMKFAKYRRETLNQIINLFWTAVCFAPLLSYWLNEEIDFYFYIFTLVSLITAFLPNRVFDLLAFSSNRKFYERLGAKTIRKLVQNGDIVKTMSAENRRPIIRDISHARKYLKNIAMYERFHWACLVFFLLTSITAFFRGYLLTGLLITAANLLYNFSSILLQQYNKLRIKKLITESSLVN